MELQTIQIVHRSRPLLSRAPSFPTACPIFGNAVRIAQYVFDQGWVWGAGDSTVQSYLAFLQNLR